MRRLLAITAALAAVAFAVPARAADHTFTVDGGQMLLDGKPFQIMCGEMHYARIPPELWRDRLKRARAMGLNTIATYCFWNLHEPQPGQFDFSGAADVARFCKIAQEEGLYVFLRPGPYSCAEWEFGGYPYWLLKDRDMKIRSADPKFLAAATHYLKRLGQELAPLQITHGGPIIMVQVENEYGSYGKDKTYLAAIRDAIKAGGFDVTLNTSDGPNQMALNGTVDGAIPTINGVGFDGLKKSTDAIRPGGPYMVGEMYPGWFDSWGKPHANVGASGVAKSIDNLLTNGASFSIYMVHGGTNFGFMNGANSPPYSPQVTSYDYDSPVSESGGLTPKYFQLRDVLLKHSPAGSIPDPPKENPAIAFTPVKLVHSLAVTDALAATPVRSPEPTCMEDLNQAYGYVLYRTTVKEAVAGELNVQYGIRDYAVILVDGKVVGTYDRHLKEQPAKDKKATNAKDQPPIMLDLKPGQRLELLVENSGRINYGGHIRDNRQGLTGVVSVGDTDLKDWENYSLPMSDLSGLKFGDADVKSVPAFREGTFTVPAAEDTFVDLRGWGKGQLWVNGHNLGRFFASVGPQQTLYIPGPWLKAGENQIVVLDLNDTGKREIGGLDRPVLNQLIKATNAATVPVGE